VSPTRRPLSHGQAGRRQGGLPRRSAGPGSHATAYPGDDEESGIKTIILAGGKGTRLLPYASVLPKPLLPLGDRAILEFVVHQLADQGFTDITLAVSQLAHLIEAVIGNGDRHNVHITYVKEDFPLGTAGSLRLVEGLDQTFLMLNGDLITTLRYRELVAYHHAQGNLLTIAVNPRDVCIDFGVVETEATDEWLRVVGYLEKPVLTRIVSMGIYVLEPEILDLVPGGYFEFPDLVQRALRAGAPVGAFRHDGLWLDVGRPDDYQEAVRLWEEGRLAGRHDPPQVTTSDTPDE
jgi:NDP-mannose synthase